MRHSLIFLLFALLSLHSAAESDENEEHEFDPDGTIYQFHAKDVDGKDVSMENGKVVIIVNVASECGFTQTNYAELKELLQRYKKDGLEVAAFPCNQFAHQEPASNAEIKEFVRKTFDFEPDLYAKVDVNGANALPLFTFLKQQAPGTLFDAIKWNFTKFVVNREGKVVARFGPTSPPSSMQGEIEIALRGIDS